MAYREYIWPVNPHRIVIAGQEETARISVLDEKQRVEPIGRRPRTVNGTGSFFGGDAFLQMNRLEELFGRGGSGTLFVPNFMPMQAFFEKLEIIGEAKKDIVSYSFLFVEDTRQVRRRQEAFTIALENENLFMIAGRTGCSVETLLSLNAFATPYDVPTGGRVLLG